MHQEVDDGVDVQTMRLPIVQMTVVICHDNKTHIIGSAKCDTVRFFFCVVSRTKPRQIG